ncbi:hypothetical protein PS903_01802 [Pseudomonas fluorescens]|nr:hypothetical protein PS903_01802 [Pseudomonas fluorescens]
MEGKHIGQNAMAFEHLGDDLRDGQALENPLLVAELQIVQHRHQGQVIASQATTRLPHGHLFDTAMNAFAIEAELQERRLAEQAFQIEVGGFTDQLDVDRVQGADGFCAVKGQYLEIVANGGDFQFEMSNIGRREHSLILEPRTTTARISNHEGMNKRLRPSKLTRRRKDECRKSRLITSEISLFQNILD